MTRRRLRSVKDIIYRGGATRPDEGAFSEIESSEESDEEFLTSSVMTIPICAGCGGVMHDPSEVGGICSIGQEIVCTVCAKEMRCLICGLIVCRAHSKPLNDGVTCQHHGFVELLLLPRRSND